MGNMQEDATRGFKISVVRRAAALVTIVDNIESFLADESTLATLHLRDLRARLPAINSYV